MDGSSSTSSGGFTNVASGGALGGHAHSGSHGGYSSPALSGAGSGVSVERTNREKVNQIVQAYFGKAAMIILHARVTLPPVHSPKTGTKKVNKWVWQFPSFYTRQVIRNSKEVVLIPSLGSSTSNLMRLMHFEKIFNYGVQGILSSQGLLQ